jgi:hypothetical protein
MQKKKSSKNRYFDEKGNSLPGVTTILQVLNKPALLNWAWKLGMEGIDYRKVRDTRAGIGTLAHDMIECELTGKELGNLDKYSVEDMEIALKCKKHFDDWRAKQVDFEVLDVELVLSGSKLGFGGTVDLYYRSGKKYILMDFKTSKACYDEHKAQQCAYKLLLEEQGKKVDEIKLFQINELKTGVVDIKKAFIPLYTGLFLGALEVYKALRAIDIVIGRTDKKTNQYKKKEPKQYLKAVKL